MLIFDCLRHVTYHLPPSLSPIYSTAHLHVTSGPGLLEVLVLHGVHGPGVGPRPLALAVLHVGRLHRAGPLQAPLLVSGARGAGVRGQQGVIT